MTPTELNQTNLDYPRFIISGTAIRNGNGSSSNFAVLHSTGLEDYQVFITPLNQDTLIPFTISAKTPDLFNVQFDTAPISGTANIQFDWMLVKVLTASIQ